MVVKMVAARLTPALMRVEDIAAKVGVSHRDLVAAVERYRAEVRSTRRASKTQLTLVHGHKRCPRCEKTKPASAFGANRAAKDRLQTYCKDCLAAYQRERYQQSKVAAR